MLFTDLVGSTRLKEELGNTEAVRLILEHHGLVRGLLREYPDGFEISTAGDSFFLAFRRPSDAVAFALRLQGRVERWNRGLRAKLLDRVGIHAGEVTVEVDGEGRIHDLHGLEVDKCARVMSLGREHHVLLTRFAFDNARASLKGVSIPEVGKVEWVSHGLYALKGVGEPMEICEVAEFGRTGLMAPEDSEKARRVAPGAAEAGGAGMSGAGTAVGGAVRPGVTRAWRWAGVAGVVLAGWLGLAVPGLVEGSYDAAYRWRRVATPAEVVLVQMDRASHDALKQPWMGPWDRGIHAALVDRMGEWGARAVVFDVVFDQPVEGHPEQDRALVEASRRFGNVFVAGERRDIEKEGLKLVGNVGPFPELEAVTTWGVSWFPARVDEVVRRPYLGNAQKEGLAAVVSRKLGKEPPAQGASIWLNYYGPPSTLAWHSYSDVMAGRVPASEFTNRVVFVGAVYDLGYPGGRRLDDLPTPYTAWTGRRSPGVEVVATTTLNFLRGETLRRTSWFMECLMLGLAGGVTAAGVMRLRMVWATVILLTVGVLVAMAGMATVWSSHVWFPWLVVCLVQLPLTWVWRAWLSMAGYSRGVAGVRKRGAAGGSGVASDKPLVATEAAVGRTGSASGDGRVVPTEAASGSGKGGGDGAGVRIPDYELLRSIGRGAYGTVWLARDAVGLVRAVKVVERRSFGDARPYDREFEGLRKFMPITLEHPGLIRVFHVGRDEERGYFYCVMELADDMEGRDTKVAGMEAAYVPRTLDAELRRRRKLPPREALGLGLALGRALAFLHGHQLIHRDLKPANVLFVRGEPRLGDIGLVTAMAPSDGRVSFLGTKGYMAPEGPGTAAADVYSLGKLLFVAATGLDPETYPGPAAGVGGVGEVGADGEVLRGLNEIWSKACEPEVERRMATAGEWLEALEALEAGRSRAGEVRG